MDYQKFMIHIQTIIFSTLHSHIHHHFIDLLIYMRFIYLVNKYKINQIIIIFLVSSLNYNLTYLIQKNMSFQSIFKKLHHKQHTNKFIQTYRTDQTEFHFTTNFQNEKQQHNGNSIGLLNQLPNTSHNQNYFNMFFSDINHFANSQQSLIDNLLSDNKQSCQKQQIIQDQLKSIDEMKSKFQNKRRVQMYGGGGWGSMERKSNNKSADRHVLKPSRIPVNCAEISEFMSNPFQNIKEDSQMYSFKNQKRWRNKSEESNSFEQIQPNNYFEQFKTFQLQSSQCYSKSQSQPHNHQSSQTLPPYSHKSLQSFMTQIKQKMTFLTNKMNHISQSNQALTKRHTTITDHNQKLINQIRKINNQSLQLGDTQQKWKKSKNELQILLRNIMEKKQRNTSNKQIMSLQDCQNYFKRKEITEVNRNVQEKKLSTKAKVENLLQRLHIRVEKS